MSLDMEISLDWRSYTVSDDRFHLRQRANEGTDLIVLSSNGNLQFSELREGVDWLLAHHYFSTTFKAQIDAGERLDVTIVKRACNFVTLSNRFELAKMHLKFDSTLSEEANHVADDREVNSAHHMRSGRDLGHYNREYIRE